MRKRRENDCTKGQDSLSKYPTFTAIPRMLGSPRSLTTRTRALITVRAGITEEAILLCTILGKICSSWGFPWRKRSFGRSSFMPSWCPSAEVEAELILASRQQEQSNNINAAMAAASRGFQSLAMDSALSSLAGGNSGFGGA